VTRSLSTRSRSGNGREPDLLVEELTPAPDPLACGERLAQLPYRVLLDSAARGTALGRYSFLAADPAVVVRSKGRTTECLTPRDGARRRLDVDALTAVRELLAPHQTAPVAGLPPFQCGAAGYIGYDWGATLERLPAPRYDDLAIPDVVLGLYDWVIAWDHAADRAWIMSSGFPVGGGAAQRRAAARLASVRQALAAPPPIIVPGAPGAAATRPLPGPPRAPSYPMADVDGANEIGLRSSFTRSAYRDAVARVREYILAGDIFQANISQRLEAPLAETPWALYRRLRALNPAPFAAYLDMGGVIVASASPERFLKLDHTRRAETRPIKGTRPRGIGPEHDAALGLALTESAKDCAENLMIVDLLRNDLSRVCEPGSVRVPELFALEHYATVHHLVSTVTGELSADADMFDLLRATFPGGSITGAPKIRAMEIIAEIEPSSRGVYCGAIGYLSSTGALDTSIVIRTYLALGDRVYFSVGGGIVADSDPEDEYRETLHKARALIRALAAGHAVGAGVL
jgi:para-aminobenzoate synthetase component 1